MKQNPAFNRIFPLLLRLWAVILFTVTACTVESDEGVQSELFIKNDTPYSVNIKTINHSSDEYEYNIDLKGGESWYEEADGGPGSGPVTDLGNDSALFTFDDTLQVSFSILDCAEDSLGVNILCSTSWNSIEPKADYDYAHEYIVTEKVYELAE